MTYQKSSTAWQKNILITILVIAILTLLSLFLYQISSFSKPKDSLDASFLSTPTTTEYNTIPLSTEIATTSHNPETTNEGTTTEIATTSEPSSTETPSTSGCTGTYSLTISWAPNSESDHISFYKVYW